MQQTISETNRRREIQLAYNEANGIIPQQITKAKVSVLGFRSEKVVAQAYSEPNFMSIASAPTAQYMSQDEIKTAIEKNKTLMKKAAKKMEFFEAAQYRDEIIRLEVLLKEKTP